MSDVVNRRNQTIPEVLRFEAKLYRRQAKMLLKIPSDVASKLAGMEKIEGMINAQPFRAATETASDGSLLLHVGTAMLRGADASEGDVVQLAVLGPEPDPVPPEDLQNEFDMFPEAVQSWEKLTKLGKRDWIRWIEDAKTPGTRVRRIARAIDQLSEGKRRACCVNVNGFMMCHIQEDANNNV